VIGWRLRKKARQNKENYLMGGKSLPWYMLGISNASGMFDISGTMWLVYILFCYGLKSVWLPWLWPTFNQIFLMIFLSAWLRRSNVLTGAEWIQTRFGRGTGANLAHLSVVFFALINVVGMLAYAFRGIGKFSRLNGRLDLGQPMASLLAAPCKHFAAAFRLHARAEPVSLGAAAAPRLIRTLWQSNPPLYYATARWSVSRGVRTALRPLLRLISNFLVY